MDGSIAAMRGYVLAGGESRRMGSDKRLELVDGAPMIDRVIGVLSAAVGIDEITIVARDTVRNGVRTIHDLRPQRGPLTGIEAALTDCPADRFCCVIAADYPLLRPGTIERLIRVALDSDADVVVPRVGDRLHPLAAMWSPRVLPAVTERLDSDMLRVTDLVEHLDASSVSAQMLGCDPIEFSNVNDQADLADARRRANVKTDAHR